MYGKMIRVIHVRYVLLEQCVMMFVMNGIYGGHRSYLRQEVMEEDNCFGCIGGCGREVRRMAETCPCSICIIKMMCRNNSCDVWTAWFTVLEFKESD